MYQYLYDNYVLDYYETNKIAHIPKYLLLVHCSFQEFVEYVEQWLCICVSGHYVVATRSGNQLKPVHYL